MEAPPLTPLVTNPLTVLLAGVGLYRLWRRPDLQPRSLAMLRIALIGHASAVVLILMFFTFTLRYRFDFAPFMMLAAFVGYRSLSMLVAGFFRDLARAYTGSCSGILCAGHLGQPLHPSRPQGVEHRRADGCAPCPLSLCAFRSRRL